MIMPISFDTDSHGTIAVGFFNIETDMLLMDRYFFFATDFCEWVIQWAADPNCREDERPVYSILNPDKIGNLAGAIYGYEYSGFIGEVYRCFPFPQTQAEFKQKTYGRQNQRTIEPIIKSHASLMKIALIFSEADLTIRIGDYVFQRAVFQEIIRYVESGGMPGWLAGKVPDYVTEMVATVDGSKHWLFMNLP